MEATHTTHLDMASIVEELTHGEGLFSRAESAKLSKSKDLTLQHCEAFGGLGCPG